MARVKVELGRSVLESQSLFTRNCWLQTGSFLLLLKMASEEDEKASVFGKDFLYSRNDQYDIIDLHFFEKQHVEK